MIEQVDHTGELELLLSHPTLEGVYAEALRGLAGLAVPGGATGGLERPVHLQASGPETLLADLLNEAVFLMETEGFVACGLRVQELEGGHLRGVVVGGVHEQVRPVVKAATYHALRLWRQDGGWRARVVLDV